MHLFRGASESGSRRFGEYIAVPSGPRPSNVRTEEIVQVSSVKSQRADTHAQDAVGLPHTTILMQPRKLSIADFFLITDFPLVTYQRFSARK
jgi:hypothetical protein